jgi:hypothetical protein
MPKSNNKRKDGTTKAGQPKSPNPPGTKNKGKDHMVPKEISREEAEERVKYFYIHCKDPETGEPLIIKTSRKITRILKDLMDTSIKHGEAFMEQEIEIQGYSREVDKEKGILNIKPYTIAKGKVEEVIGMLGEQLLSKEEAIVHLRRFLTRLMDQSELVMVSFDAVVDNEREGVTMTGETVIDPTPENVKDNHFIVMDNSMKAHINRLREFGEEQGVKYPENQDEVKNLVLPGDAAFSVPLDKGLASG